MGAWGSLSPGQQGASRRADVSGDTGLTQEADPTAFHDTPGLVDRGYLAEAQTGCLVITATGRAIVRLEGEDPATQVIEDAG